MSLVQIHQEASDLKGNRLVLWNDPSVGIFRPVVVWYHTTYGEVSFEGDTDEHVEQLFQLLQSVREFSVESVPEEIMAQLAPGQDPVEVAVRDLLAKGFIDVTPQVERKCPGYDPEYVFRGPDGMLYRCWSGSAVFRVFAAYERLGVKVPPGETWYHSV